MLQTGSMHIGGIALHIGYVADNMHIGYIADNDCFLVFLETMWNAHRICCTDSDDNFVVTAITQVLLAQFDSNLVCV